MTCYSEILVVWPSHIAKANQELHKVMKWKILKWLSESSDLSPTVHAFH